MALTKRLRFEILRRDNHTCRYCGATAPHVRLTVDHVIPTALGGTDEPANLVAACVDCNSGKSATPPSAPLVDDVAADALRWARAMAYAAHEQQRARDSDDALLEYFRDLWTTHVGTQLPHDHTRGVLQIRTAGARIDDLDHAVEVTGRSHRDDAWTYFCGVAYGILRDRTARARQLLNTGVVA